MTAREKPKSTEAEMDDNFPCDPLVICQGTKKGIIGIDNKY